MIAITQNVPPVTTFGDLAPSSAFVSGGGNIAHAKLAAPEGAFNAIRLADLVLVTVADATQVSPAPGAVITMFP